MYLRFLLGLGVCLLLAIPGNSQTRNGSPEAVDLDVLVPPTAMYLLDADNLSNWEPESAVLGDGTLLVVANTFAEGDAGGNSEVAVIVAIYPDGSVEEYAGFLADDGTPYLGNMDTIRTDGNPPKIAGDLRDGSARYAVANESTPYNYDEFTSDDRWANDYIDHIFAVQILELTPDGPQKITNVFDPMYGAQSDLVVGKIRTGGVVFLSNGNLLVGAEDRSLEGASPKAPNISIIDGETGEIIHGPIHVLGTGEYDFWEGLAAFNGGFAVRVGNGGVVDGNATTIIKFYDNDGNELGAGCRRVIPPSSRSISVIIPKALPLRSRPPDAAMAMG